MQKLGIHQHDIVIVIDYYFETCHLLSSLHGRPVGMPGSVDLLMLSGHAVWFEDNLFSQLP
jgi:hypothetical protein